MYEGYSKFFDSIGIGSSDIGIIILILFILLIILIVMVIILMKKLNTLQQKLNIFMSGKDGMSLEQDLLSLHEENKFLKACADKNKKDIRVLYKKAQKSFCKQGLVKYDAFKQLGGQLSFCLALLDEDNNGFIINSVHSTEGCYSYTKAVVKGVSDLDLCKEEEQALAMARGEM